MTQLTGVHQTASVDLCRELTTLLAVNAYHLIERNDHVFDFVTGSDQHLGSPSREIDAANETLANHWLNQERIQHTAPDGIFMHSEEATRPWRGTSVNRPWLLQVDEFDGTTIATGSAANWAVSALAFVWSYRRNTYSLAGGAIAGHDGHVVTYRNNTKHIDGVRSAISGDVWFQRYNMFTERAPGCLDPVELGPETEVQDVSSGATDMVAINAAAGDRGSALLDKYASLLTGTQYRTVCAGTPAIYGAIRGRIGMIVDPEPATLHDANHLFPLAFLGWEIIGLEHMDRVNLFGLAEANCQPGRVKRPIPPNVAVRSPQAFEMFKRLAHPTASAA